MSTVVDRLYSLIEQGKQGHNIGLSTGLSKLDKTIFGILRKSVIVCGAQTAVGKSSLTYYSYLFRPLMEIWKGNIKDCWFLVFSFEISEEVLYAKLLSLYIQEEFGVIMSYRDILSLTRKLPEEGEQYILAAREWLNMVYEHVAVIDKPMNAEQIDIVMRQFVERYGKFETGEDGNELYIPNNPQQYIICIMDHLALINQRPLKVGIDEVSKIFIYYRNKCSITGILLQQLNRNMMNMERRNSGFNMPDLSDFQDSSGACQAAEFVIALYDAYREKQKTCLDYDIEILKNNFRAIIVLKNRIGENNKIFGVNFLGVIGRWNDLPLAAEIDDYTPYLHPEGKYLEYPKDNN